MVQYTQQYTARGRSIRALESLWRHLSMFDNALFRFRRWCGNVCVTYIRELRSCREKHCKPFPRGTTVSCPACRKLMRKFKNTSKSLSSIPCTVNYFINSISTSKCTFYILRILLLICFYISAQLPSSESLEHCCSKEEPWSYTSNVQVWFCHFQIVHSWRPSNKTRHNICVLCCVCVHADITWTPTRMLS